MILAKDFTVSSWVTSFLWIWITHSLHFNRSIWCWNCCNNLLPSILHVHSQCDCFYVDDLQRYLQNLVKMLSCKQVRLQYILMDLKLGKFIQEHWYATPHIQAGKYVVRAENLHRARKLPCTQRPIKQAEFEKYTWKMFHFLWGGDVMAVFPSTHIWCGKISLAGRKQTFQSCLI